MKKNRSFFQGPGKRLYCIADTPETCEKLLRGGAKIIQYRNKIVDEETFHACAKKMMSMVGEYPDAALVINDRVQTAIDIHAHGVHVGREDEDFHEVVSRVPEDMIVGVSVDTVEQAVEAREAGADYLGAGAVFPTPSKEDAVIIGLSALRDIVAAVSIPVVAIGGISLENIGDVIDTGVEACAVISQVNSAPDIPARIRAFNRILEDSGKNQ